MPGTCNESIVGLLLWIVFYRTPVDNLRPLPHPDLKNADLELLALLVWHDNQYLILVSKSGDELGDVSTPATGLHDHDSIHHSSWSGGNKDAFDGNKRRPPRLPWT